VKKAKEGKGELGWVVCDGSLPSFLPSLIQSGEIQAGRLKETVSLAG